MRIKEVRKSKHMTQKELAEKIGVDLSVISRYESGTIIPPSNRLDQIARELNVSVDYLLEDTGNNDFSIDHTGNGKHFSIIWEPKDMDRFYVANSAQNKRLLYYAKGVCELCLSKAPFLDKDGVPYLETHYIHWLSEGGQPTLDNTVALCPNCHQRVHVLNDPDDIEKLKKIAAKHK